MEAEVKFNIKEGGKLQVRLSVSGHTQLCLVVPASNKRIIICSLSANN